MTKLLILFSPLILFSCGQSPEYTGADDLTIEVDTLMVDAGGEILDLNGEDFALSPDRRYLYNFNKYDHSLEKIDLEERRLVEKMPFEEEGPNGTGKSVSYLNMLDESHIQLSDDRTSGQFHVNGTRLVSRNLYNNGLHGDVLTESERLGKNTIVPGQPDILFSIVSDWKDKTFSLRKMDFQQKRIKKYDFDPEEKFAKFSFKVPSLSKDLIISPSLFLSAESGKLTISSDITNEIHLYDPISDSLISKKNSHRLTASEKDGEFPGTYASIEALMVDYQKVLEEVSFSPPVWDRDTEQFYRLSYRVEFTEEKEPGALLPNNKRTHVFLSIYDRDFNLKGEAPVPQLEKSIPRYFVRNGKLWLVENIDDELGFIRLQFK